MKTLDHITRAVNLVRTYGEGEASSYFCRSMADEDRLRFDAFLVKTGDELAYEPGTCESRFKTRVLRMAKLAESI